MTAAPSPATTGQVTTPAALARLCDAQRAAYADKTLAAVVVHFNDTPLIEVFKAPANVAGIRPSRKWFNPNSIYLEDAPAVTPSRAADEALAASW